MKNFRKKLNNVSQSALDFLKEKINNKLLIVTDEQLEEDNDLIHELPMVSYVGKYSIYDEYAVVSIEKRDKDLIVHTKGKGEVSNKEREFLIEEMDNSNLCSLADMVSKLI